MVDLVRQRHQGTSRDDSKYKYLKNIALSPLCLSRCYLLVRITSQVPGGKPPIAFPAGMRAGLFWDQISRLHLDSYLPFS
jgi:hypothetical protein